MRQLWMLKKIATTAIALAAVNLAQAQTGAGATTGTQNPGAESMQSAPGRYDAGSDAKGDKGEYGRKGDAAKKGTDMDRRGDDSSTDYRSGGSSAGGSGGGTAGTGGGSGGSYGSGSGGHSGGGGSKY